MILSKTKAITRRPFAVLDIGSSKICCMIGEANGAGGVRLLGHGTHASAGIRSGEVSELEALSTVIGKTVLAAERYISHGCCPRRHTIFKHLQKISQAK
jgi:cell division ATPase FtsA